MAINSSLVYARVSYGFATLRPTLQVSLGRNVVDKMTGNESYDPTDPTLAALTTQLDATEAAILAAINRDRVAIAARNAQVLTLTNLLRQMAAYVQNACAGDLTTLLSSGYDVVRGRTPVGQLPMPGDFTLTLTGNPGEVLAKWKRMPNAASYVVQIATSPDGEFVSQMPCTASRLVLTGLTSLKTIYVRVCANGSAGPGLFTPAIPVTML